MKRTIDINPESRVRFHNGVDFCVGTGRMGLALQKEYQEQLKLVQDVIGFKHIRGHGLFCDDMAIYQESMMDGEVVVEYNFTYLDMVMDSYIKLGLKPFISGSGPTIYLIEPSNEDVVLVNALLQEDDFILKTTTL